MTHRQGRVNINIKRKGGIEMEDTGLLLAIVEVQRSPSAFN